MAKSFRIKVGLFVFCVKIHVTMTTIQLLAGVNRRYASLAGVTLVAIWLQVVLDQTYRFPKHVDQNIYSNRLQSPGATTITTDAFDFALIDSEFVKGICGNTQWNASLIFTCDNSVGGVRNIRNSILNCVRYAILASGSLVVPRIIVQNSEDIANIRTSERTEIDYMFDRHHFTKSLYLSCPLLRLYNTIGDIPNQRNAHDLISLLPESLVKSVPKNGLADLEQ